MEFKPIRHPLLLLSDIMYLRKHGASDACILVHNDGGYIIADKPRVMEQFVCLDPHVEEFTLADPIVELHQAMFNTIDYRYMFFEGADPSADAVKIFILTFLLSLCSEDRDHPYTEGSTSLHKPAPIVHNALVLIDIFVAKLRQQLQGQHLIDLHKRKAELEAELKWVDEQIREES